MSDFNPRRQVFTTPSMPQRRDMKAMGYGSPIKGYTSFDPAYMQPSPQQAAMGLFNLGVKIDSLGNPVPTQDFGAMTAASSQGINSLSRGVKAGQFSSMGQPLNTMYAQDPNFFNRRPDASTFGAMIAQRNQQTSQMGIPNPQSSAYRGPYRPGFVGTTEQQKIDNRAALQEQVDAKRMLGQESGDIPTVTYKTGFGTDYSPGRQASMASGETPIGKRDIVTISGKYGTGSSRFSAPGTPRKEGLIEGRPASEVLQGLANKPGLARPGDKFQPQKLTAADSSAMNKAMSKFPLKNPLKR